MTLLDPEIIKLKKETGFTSWREVDSEKRKKKLEEIKEKWDRHYRNEVTLINDFLVSIIVTGEIGPEEQKEFHKWLHEHPINNFMREVEEYLGIPLIKYMKEVEKKCLGIMD